MPDSWWSTGPPQRHVLVRRNFVGWRGTSHLAIKLEIGLDLVRMCMLYIHEFGEGWNVAEARNLSLKKLN